MRRLTMLVLLGMLVCAAGPAGAQRREAATSGTVAVVTLRGPVDEVPNPLALFGPKRQTLRELTERIERAAGDPAVHGLFVKMERPSLGPAQAVELHDVLRAARNKGKRVIVFADSVNLYTYHVASAGDRVVMPPVGTVEIFGVAAHLYYFRDLLAKLGMDAQAIEMKEFKTALEPLLRQEMSEETRVQVTELVEDYAAHFVREIAAARGMDEVDVTDALWSGPYTSTKALEAGLITDIAYDSNFREDYAREHGVNFDDKYGRREARRPEPMSLLSLLGGMTPGRGPAAARAEQIALIYAVGPIIDGRADQNPFASYQTIASEDFIDLIDEAMKDGTTRAIVLRIDSPGGSAAASDRIWHHLERVQQQHNVPLVASMGNVAASGGYYIAMGADRIVAEPTTVTGSIGAVLGRLVLGGTYEKIGVTKQMLAVGPHAGIVDETRAWNEDELGILNNILDELYRAFTEKAAQSRGMSIEEMKAVARGRVWSGIGAQRAGLVDELGGLSRAIEIARDLSGAPDARVVAYPKELTLFEFIEKALSGELGVQMTGSPVAPGAALPPMLQGMDALLPRRQVETFWTTLRLLGEEPRVLMYDPVAFEVR